MNAIKWPKKHRELLNNHIDPTIWNGFLFRNDDIFIATYAKSGTTWIQQIVSQLIFNGETGLDVAEMSPWIDFRLPPKDIKFTAIENQQHRRFLKTHLPLDALVYSPKAKISILHATVAMCCGVFTIITPLRLNPFIQRSTRPADLASNPLSHPVKILLNTIVNGWSVTVIPTGLSGKTSPPGGNIATCLIY